jgi:dipicolinate synthase subunit A
MEIMTFGGGGRMRECLRLLKRALAEDNGRLILLPIPTSRDNIFINSTEVTVGTVTELIGENSIVVGYSLPRLITDRAREVGAKTYDPSLDEEFLLANAKISANGALGYILTHSVKDLRDMKIGVVGYGRIGREMTRLCLLFGAEVTVYTARESVMLELCEIGVDARPIDDLSDLDKLDILINTTPKRQIDEGKIPEGLEIIDLASGKIFEPRERLIKLSSIPDAFYPETAGRLYAEGVLRFLGKEGAV